MKVHRPKTFALCGLTCEGATVAEAKAECLRRLTLLVSEADSPPELVTVDGSSALVWRALDTWADATVLDPETGQRQPRRRSFGSERTRDEALCAARSHVMHNAWSPAIPVDAEWIALHAMPVSDEPARQRLIRDMTAWCLFQRRYHAYLADGHDTQAAANLAHDWRSDAPRSALLGVGA